MTAKIKTRDRILKTSLALFNAEGEAQVSTVDIAAVLGISPGNLYYHFKGKEAIIDALFGAFEVELRQVLSAPLQRPVSFEDNWVFIYIVFEEINDFRFFYEGMASILERCAHLRPRLARLLALKRATTLSVLSSLEEQKLIAFIGDEKDRLADRIAAHFTFWLQYRAVTQAEQSDRARINDAVYATILMIAPFLAGERSAYLRTAATHFAATAKKRG
ncbi:MAG: TetR/AcrR family transcriptional regulator [Parvularculaceae bacterium]|nr:TetR/AcrR family transcriptional regulator [Parvularculaceae bacterium]